MTFRLKPKTLAAVSLLLATSVSLGACETFEQFLSPPNKANIRGERVSVLPTARTVEADPKLANEAVKLPKPTVNAEWPQPGGYADNVMHHLAAGGELQQQWSVSVGQGSSTSSRLTASPVVAAGKVFVLDSEVEVSAYDSKSGDRLWQSNLTPEDEDSEDGFGGGVAFDNGKVFVSTGFGFVAALDANTGKEIWRRATTVPFRAAPVVNGGRVFVATQENQLMALAEDDGRVLWDHRGIAESAGILGSNSVAVSGDLVVVPYTSGELFGLNVRNGRSLWSDTLARTGGLTPLSTLADISGRPVIDRGLVFANSHAGRIVAIDIRTGERAWTIDVGGTQRPWVVGDYVYVITDDAKVMCVRRADGRVRWITQLDAYRDAETRQGTISWSGPVLVSDRLIALSSEGFAVSISPYTGEVLGRVDIPDKAFIAPVVADGIVYLLTDDGRLTALK
ncbi:MAG: PQQ-binding-like beta-propeller repeat protein [Alphaproteobacteria bacterium]|jgi:outer membrane protein assembly factor BamB|nr:PQQ-binding-like beta-propeller repeat protein [Alphaproteobacteria bacterium]